MKLGRAAFRRVSRPARTAFSLVELLVVVAIIALLAALLLPALARSKDSARRLKCVSNLHQLGLATHMYWDDHSGACFRYSPTNGSQLYWFGAITPGPEGTRVFDPSPGVLYEYLRGRGVELCPSFNYCSRQVKLKATGASYGYGYNLSLSAPPRAPVVNTSQLPQPANLALLADAAQINTWQAPASKSNPMLEEWYYIDSNPSQPNGHFRHNQRGNVLFCDGHVAAESMLPGSLDTRLPSQSVGRFSSDILLLPR